MLEVCDLSFQYYLSSQKNLKHISLNIEEAEIVVIVGKSGSGKTTLLRHFKKELMPKGKRDGCIQYMGKNIETLSNFESASKIGYVFQNPHNQIVEDHVYHEIAFGLENLGISYDEMNTRVAEIIQYFHLEDIYDKHTYELSGGQKQLVTLASIMIMQPQVLLLDEPLAQLDPKSRQEFVSMLKRIHDDFGTTIIMVSHHLEEIMNDIDRMIVLQEGRKIVEGNVQTTIEKVKDDELLEIFPPYIQLLTKLHLPTNLSFYQTKKKINPLRSIERKYSNNLPCLSVKHLYASYEHEVLKDFSLIIPKQEIFCLLGNNGSGKTTFLKCLMKEMKYKGKIDYQGQLGYLPQDPLLLISRDSVYDELYGNKKINKNTVNFLVDYFHFNDLLEYHPYDLSGGQQQILAIMKLLLYQSDILLLDEPTKAIDPIMKRKLGLLLEELIHTGKTIICVSHDLEFCGEFATMIGLLFHHQVLNVSRPKEFFKKHYFYTTQLSKLTRDYTHIISLKDVML